MTSDQVQTLLDSLAPCAHNEELAPAASATSDWIRRATDEEVEQILAGLLNLPEPPEGVRDRRLVPVFHQLARRLREENAPRMPAATLDLVRRLYYRLGQASRARCYLLQLLATARSVEDLRAFAELCVEDPPQHRDDVGLAFSPLFQRKGYDPSGLFPRLLEAICHPIAAASIVDLANFVTREGLANEHPAKPRRRQLAGILGEIVQRLALLEEPTEIRQESLAPIARQVEDAAALVVGLCDALALIGDSTCVGKLYQALELSHRRIRTEAAGALARFGEETGKKTLIELAAEPVCRLRVIAYAQELGLEDQIAEHYRTAASLAESDLALWLAQPSQLGLPPTRMELLDEREQFWPGFDEPVECFLFRYIYEFPNAQVANIGIAGPLTHAFAADLADLPPDDIYAAFAGWHAQHEEIYEVDVEDLHQAARLDVARLERRLRDAGHTEIGSLQLGFFFGERMLVARTSREGIDGIAVASQQEILWYPSAGRQRPLGAHEACCIYKGRKLLRSFNP